MKTYEQFAVNPNPEENKARSPRIRGIVLACAITLGLASFSILSGCSLFDGSGSQSGGSIKLNNDTGVDLLYAYISPTSDDTWGNDILGESVLSDGSSFTKTGLEAGTYDILIVTVPYDDYSSYFYGLKDSVTVNSSNVVTISCNDDFIWYFVDNSPSASAAGKVYPARPDNAPHLSRGIKTAQPVLPGR